MVAHCVNCTITNDNILDMQSDVEPSSILNRMSDAEILDLITTIPKLTKTCLNLQNNLVAVRNEFSMYRSDCEKRFNAIEQYSRRNSLLLEFLRNVPRRAHGAKFSKYIVGELNKLFPHLRICCADIDASHILYYKDDDEITSCSC